MPGARLAKQSAFAPLTAAAPMQGAPIEVVDGELTATTAIEKLWKKLYEMLRNWALASAARWVGLDMAADIFQEVMFSYWRRRDKLKQEEFNEARIKSAVRKRVVTHVTRNRQFVSLTPELEDTGVVPHIRPRGTDANVDLAEAILEAANKLAPRRRTAWMMCRVDGFSREEGAQMMGITVGTFSVHLYEAGLLIKEALKDAGFGPELIAWGVSTRALPAKTEASND